MQHANWKNGALTIMAAAAVGCGSTATPPESSADGGEGGADGGASETASAGDGSGTGGGGDGDGGIGDTGDGSAGATGNDGGSDDGGPEPIGGCGFAGGLLADPGVDCFFDLDNPTQVVGAIEHIEIDFDGQAAIYIRLILTPEFVDNTYGGTSIGWESRGEHELRELVGSDHAEIQIKDRNGDPILHFKVDYISEDDQTPSGYRSLGVWDGDGDIMSGDETAILAATSSLDRNFNEFGYSAWQVNSPPTNADYAPFPYTPMWDYRVVYEVVIAKSAIDHDDLAQACVEFIHASPSKVDDNTKEVIPDECPPGWGCFDAEGCEIPQCEANPDGGGCGEGFPPIP